MTYLNIMTKQKRHRKIDPQRVKLAIERDIEEVLRIKQEQGNGAIYTLISVQAKDFIYELSKNGSKKQFRVPYTALSNGGVFLDFAEQTAMDIQTNKSNKEDQTMLIFKATEQSEMEYKKGMKKTGGQQMNTEVLYPTGIIQSSKQEDEQKWQEEAEKSEILLPTQLNRSRTSTLQQQAEDETEILLPIGY